jgi:hypothetical protein
MTALAVVEGSLSDQLITVVTSNFLLKYSLGIISNMTWFIQSGNPNMKHMVTGSLPCFIELIGPPISTISPSVMGLISCCINHNLDVLEIIEKFIRTLEQNFSKLCLQIYVMLLDASLISDKERNFRVISTILNFPKCQTYLIYFPSLPETQEFITLRQNAYNFPLFDRLSALNSNLEVQNNSLVIRSLASIKDLILRNEMEIQSTFLSELSNTKLHELLQGLFSASVKFCNTSPAISILCTECIGILGIFYFK